MASIDEKIVCLCKVLFILTINVTEIILGNESLLTLSYGMVLIYIS
jgi:hypothetical protein